MTKIYEALEMANDGSQDIKAETGRTQLMGALSPMEQKMIDLYQNINALLPDKSSRIVQFIAANKGEGNSTIVLELAKLMFGRFGKKVLMLVSDLTQAGYKNYHCENDLNSLLGKMHEGEDNPIQSDEASLSITRISSTTPIPSYVDSKEFDDALKSLRDVFDYVLIDSPPSSLSSDGLSLCYKVDGVILVVEAEKTRWEVAENLKKRVQNQDGNILGVVLNKKKDHIPKFIYKRL
ncbi:MAG: AAA family ATPase [Candidatus Omnitrophica bacterium]|nr:AAA family ATPase [Candidatus Omnitrophota bacterium]